PGYTSNMILILSTVSALTACLACKLGFACLLIGGTATSTLFPYTTLFRSGRGIRQPGAAGEPVTGDEVAGADEAEEGGADGEAPDRKSTRLNSSHVSISYAVFCLKKKSGARPL